jgi:hypothetical protein
MTRKINISTRPKRPRRPKVDGPRVEEDNLNVKDEEKHGNDIITDRNTFPGIVDRGNTALIGSVFVPIGVIGGE